MSFDLVLYNKQTAPTLPKEFNRWFAEQRDVDANDDNYDCDNHEQLSPRLKAVFMEIIKTFPPLNGSLAPSDDEIDEDEELENRLTDFELHKDLIYAGIAWSQVEAATECFLGAAQEHGVGMYNPQSGEIVDIDF